MPTQTLGKVKLTPRGAYDPAAAYVPLDIVSYGGGSYCVLKNVTGVTPTGDDVNYQLLAESGADGKSPQISASKTWLVWDANKGEYVDTGVSAAGEIPELDTTLTQSGKAADAAVVGDALTGKQDTISDLEAIRSGAALGATALQSVSTDDIDERAVTNAKISNGAISTGKIANKAVTEDKLSTEFVAKVDGKQDKITSTNKLAYSLISGTPTIPTVPDKLPNPNALTFTGAVTGSYDGSAPVSVEIPSGGGSGSAENWRLVNTVTTAEDVSNITITQDSDGNPLSLKKVKIFAKVRGNSASLSTWCRITANNLTNNFYCDLQNTFAAKEGQDYYNYARADFAIYAGRLMLELLLRSANNAASKNTLWWVNNSGCFENYPDVVDAITSIRMWSASAGIGAGTELMIYGVDA